MKRFLEIIAVVLVCVAALGAAAYYVAGPGRERAAKPAEQKGHGHGREEKGHDDHDSGVTMSDAQVAAGGIELATAGPRELRDILRVNGLIQPNQEALVKITPRFPGVVRSMRKRLGDQVKAGEMLATVESNQSLTTYEMKAPIDGTVIDRDGTLGEFASEQKPLFTVADLSTMWIDFSVYRRDFSRVRVGDAVSIDVEDGGPPLEARIDYVSPLGTSDTQSSIARAVVANAGRLRPGLFVTGRVVLSAKPVEVAIKASALQSLDGKNVAFVRNGDKFEAREVELGGRDMEWIEVTFGLLAGDVYAAKNSFVIKADFGKGGAAHEH
jgi:cobalt-zinc-cadmium efflux system membrane fusion protein